LVYDAVTSLTRAALAASALLGDGVNFVEEEDARC